MVGTTIPVIDFIEFSDRCADIARQVFEACKSIGFFYITNHSIPAWQVAQAFARSEKFFEMSMERKMEYAKRENCYAGYLGLYAQTSNPDRQNYADHKEAYDFMPFTENVNLSHMPDLFLEQKDDIESFSKNLYAMAVQVLELISIALKLPSKGKVDWLTQCHRYEEPPVTNLLRYQRYPAGDAEKHKDEPQAGEHTDYGTITLLFQKDVPGLEVKGPDDTWHPVPIIAGGLLVNVGRMLEIWTHGLFKAAMHRVVFTPQQERHDRYSIAYFVQPQKSVKLTDMPSPILPQKPASFDDVPDGILELTAHDYLQYLYQKSLMKRAPEDTKAPQGD
ncbi:hypothetical protein BJV82DRAFT_617435 [Fennellomyces sp. T-0311]|nr:hypothetical protein BJV82DRAFT_617435 [Fennellomyces sp. T-0311]